MRGMRQVDIAKSVGVSQATVSRELLGLQGEWASVSASKIDEAKARELAKIDNLEREYWDAWERSQNDAETVIEEAFGVKKSKTQNKRVGQVGNPAFLRGVEWCIERRARLLGLDAPTKAEVDNSGKVIVEFTNDWRGQQED